MKKLHRWLCLLTLLAVLLSGCGKADETKTPYNEDISSGMGSSSAVKTDKSELLWDDENKCVIFKASDGAVWSTIPYEYLQSGGSSANVTSPINITVSDTDTLNTEEIKGSRGAVSDGRVIAENIENGIRVTYYFDLQKISVPVLYTLSGDGLSVTLESGRISEASHYKLLSVELAPYLCAAQNSKENYLLVPSGNGALMYTNADTKGTRKYSAEIYGNDAAHLKPTPQSYETTAKMPVFAAKKGNRALLAIVTEGDEHITVMAEAGNSRTEWSAVWPKITVRGVDIVETQLPQSRLEDISYVSESTIKDNVTVKYIPLSDSMANYNGMAQCYREYLLENKLLIKSDKKANAYSITLYGGAQIKNLFLGIPYNKTESLTSFKETAEIVESLINSTGKVPEVQLIGYGKNGINIGKVGGGFAFAESLGSNKDLKALLKLFEENKASYYFDFDIVRYNQSSSGFSATFDVAKTAAQHSATLKTVDIALAGFGDVEYHLLAREKLYSAAEKIIKLANKKGISGVALNSLGNMSYSDYTNADTAAKGGLTQQVKEIVNNFKENGISFSADNTNLYSALVADSVFGFSDKQELNAVDMSIPFYQMVIGGTKSLYSVPVNTADNPKQEIMKAAAYGLGLNFECIGSYNVDIDLNGYSFYGATFNKQKETIADYVKGYLETFSKIEGAAIKEYNMLTSCISRTVYDNGVTVYANHSEKEASFGGVTLKGYEYKVAE